MGKVNWLSLLAIFCLAVPGVMNLLGHAPSLELLVYTGTAATTAAVLSLHYR